MSDKTGIEWTDATWNPLVGCSRVSAGCINCYAERHAYRFARMEGSVYEGTARLVNGKPTFTGRVNINPRVLDQPMRWKSPRRIFVNSMSDVFHESVSDSTILGLFAVMAAAPQHQFQILTKRPARALEWFERVHGMAHGDVGTLLHEAAKGLFGYHDRRRPVIQADSVPWPLANVWLGVSVEDQAAANERIPLLLQTPAAVRFLSCEPLLGSIKLDQVVGDPSNAPFSALDNKNSQGRVRCVEHADGYCMGNCEWRLPAVDWVIAGGESGPRARPMHPDWVRSLRDQCAAAGAPFFFKQWGEWWESDSDARDEETGGHVEVDADGINARDLWDPRLNCLIARDGRRFTPEDLPVGTPGRLMCRIGKKAAGHLLDGAEHHAFPKAA